MKRPTRPTYLLLSCSTSLSSPLALPRINISNNFFTCWLCFSCKTCTIEFPEFSALMAYPIHKPTVFVTSHHGLCLWPVEKLNYAYGPPSESFTVGFFVALLSERKILLTVLFAAHSMASIHPCTVLNFTAPIVHQIHLWKRVQRRGRLSRVNGPSKSNKSQGHSNQRKKRSISKPVIFYCKIVATESSCWPPYSGSAIIQQQKVVPLSRLEFVMSSLVVVLMRIFLKETTCIVPPGVCHCLSYERWARSISQPRAGGGEGGEGGEGEVNWTLKKVTKIKSDHLLKFSSPQ